MTALTTRARQTAVAEHKNYIPILATEKIDAKGAYQILKERVVIMQAAGRWRSSAAETKLVLKDLANRLDGHNLGDVQAALAAHLADPKHGSYFPDYAQLMVHMQPRIDFRINHYERERRNRKHVEDVKKSREFEQEPLEVRQRAVGSWHKLRAQWAEDEAREEREKQAKKRKGKTHGEKDSIENPG